MSPVGLQQPQKHSYPMMTVRLTNGKVNLLLNKTNKKISFIFVVSNYTLARAHKIMY